MITTPLLFLYDLPTLKRNFLLKEKPNVITILKIEKSNAQNYNLFFKVEEAFRKHTKINLEEKVIKQEKSMRGEVEFNNKPIPWKSLSSTIHVCFIDTILTSIMWTL